jgi:hypothetical protein
MPDNNAHFEVLFVIASIIKELDGFTMEYGLIGC